MTPEARVKAAGCACHKCPYAKDGEPNKPVMPVGPTRNPDAVMIGDSPSHDDVRSGEPFTGPTGKALDEVLLEAGLTRERLLLANVIACVPAEPRTKPAQTKALKCCQPFIKQVLAALPVDVPVALMGAAAVHSVAGVTKGAAGMRGFIDFGWDLRKACPPLESNPKK